MTITTASYADANWPGIKNFFGMAYNRYPQQWAEIFDKYTSDKNFERDVLVSGLSLFRVKPELAPLQYDDMSQVRRVDYTHITYGLGFVMSRESIEDNLYPELEKMRADELGMKAALTEEILAALWVSRCFSNSYLQSDGVPVISTAHPLARGGTAANRPTNGTDFSEAALENMLILIRNTVDDTGNRINLRPTKLIVPEELRYDVQRVMGNPDRPGTAERDINAMYQIGDLSMGYSVNNYIGQNDTDAWFIKTDCPNGLKHYQRRAVEFTNDTSDFDTENARFKCTFRSSRGISNWRAWFGSPGA